VKPDELVAANNLLIVVPSTGKKMNWSAALAELPPWANDLSDHN
jgi:hypothetical protein